MSRAVIAGAVAAVIAAAAAWLVVTGAQRPPVHSSAMVMPAAAEQSGRPIYYQDPDGKPSYSLTPKKTQDGRDYRAVPAGADVSFDDAAAEAKPAASATTTERKIKYYRHPMGLPDTSPVPKKDSMGMDYIAVYEGEDSDDGSVKLSPGKIQRTGVKSEPVSRRADQIDGAGAGDDSTRRAPRFRHRNEVRKLCPEGRRRHHGIARRQGPAA